MGTVLHTERRRIHFAAYFRDGGIRRRCDPGGQARARGSRFVAVPAIRPGTSGPTVLQLALGTRREAFGRVEDEACRPRGNAPGMAPSENIVGEHTAGVDALGTFHSEFRQGCESQKGKEHALEPCELHAAIAGGNTLMRSLQPADLARAECTVGALHGHPGMGAGPVHVLEGTDLR